MSLVSFLSLALNIENWGSERLWPFPKITGEVNKRQSFPMSMDKMLYKPRDKEWTAHLIGKKQGMTLQEKKFRVAWALSDQRANDGGRWQRILNILLKLESNTAGPSRKGETCGSLWGEKKEWLLPFTKKFTSIHSLS